jgi:hypothetical protein
MRPVLLENHQRVRFPGSCSAARVQFLGSNARDPRESAGQTTNV